MSKIVLSGHILVPEQDLAAVRQALPTHCRLTTDEPGCITFSVEEDTTVAGKFDVYEEFRSQDAFEFHQRRVAASDWGKISRSAERFYSVREVEDNTP